MGACARNAEIRRHIPDLLAFVFLLGRDVGKLQEGLRRHLSVRCWRGVTKEQTHGELCLLFPVFFLDFISLLMLFPWVTKFCLPYSLDLSPMDASSSISKTFCRESAFQEFVESRGMDFFFRLFFFFFCFVLVFYFYFFISWRLITIL